MKAEDKERLIRLFQGHLGERNHARRLFDFLIQDEICQRAKPLSEPEILAAVFPSHDIKNVDEARGKLKEGSNSQVRKAAGSIRTAAEIIGSSTEGRRLPVGLRFPRGVYQIEFVEKDVYVTQFWQPYVDIENPRPALLIYSESVFFRSVSGRYLVRHLDLNEPSADPKSKLPFLPEADLPLQPSRQFVVSGNTGTLLYLTRWLERISVRTDHAVAHQCSAQFLANKNLIILGTKRTVPMIERLSHGFNFEVENNGIANRLPVDSDPVRSSDDDRSFYADDLRAPGVVRGLLLRTFDARLCSWITIISSNNGRFHEALAHYLTNEQQVAHLLRALAGSSDAPLPSRFEALFESDIERFEDNPRPSFRVELLATRVYS